MDRHLLRFQALTGPLSDSCDSYNSWSNQVLRNDADANGRGIASQFEGGGGFFQW
jgi:hypothetical protein